MTNDELAEAINDLSSYIENDAISLLIAKLHADAREAAATIEAKEEVIGSLNSEITSLRRQIETLTRILGGALHQSLPRVPAPNGGAA